VLQDRRETYYHNRVRDAGSRYAGFDLASVEMYLSFLYANDVLLQVLNRCMSEYGLSKSTVNILMLLRHGPAEGMQLHDLGELLLVSRANITGLIDHLEEKGYVRRVVDAQDRRARYARITGKGEALLDEFMPVHYRTIKTLLQDLTGEEKLALIHLLKKVRASVSAHEVECGAQRSIGYPAAG
jgi:MarR family 2-MHQ and catechol resistance regulon transcriptional repressor